MIKQIKLARADRVGEIVARCNGNRWFLVALLLIAAAVPIPVLAQASMPAPSNPSPDELLSMERGERIYRRACATCHGREGDGKGPAARYLDPLPRDFTSGIYKFRSTPSGTLPTDADLFRTVSEGIPTTSMPAFEHILGPQASRDVVEYIKRFSEKFVMRAGTPLEIPEEPEATAQSVAEGKSNFMKLACWTCHGVSGQADGVLGNALMNAWGQPIRPARFASPGRKSGRDNASLFRTISTGLDGTPMVSYGGAFAFAGASSGSFSMYEELYSESEIAALKTYLESQPTGEQMASITDSELQELTNRRKWALVHYVKSLSSDPGWLDRLFVQDTEVTR